MRLCVYHRVGLGDPKLPSLPAVVSCKIRLSMPKDCRPKPFLPRSNHRKARPSMSISATNALLSPTSTRAEPNRTASPGRASAATHARPGLSNPHAFLLFHHTRVNPCPWLGCNAHLQRRAAAACTQARGTWLPSSLSRMCMYVSGRAVEQGVHKYVGCKAVLGLGGYSLGTGGTAGVFMRVGRAARVCRSLQWLMFG